MLEGFNQWATANPDAAYLVGFSVVVLIFYGLAPYKLGLSVATSRDVPFKSVDVWGQIKKPHRFGLSAGAVAGFALVHFALGAPLMALVVGLALITALTISDYRQMQQDSRSSA